MIDTIARGLALQARSGSVTQGRFDRIGRALSRGALRNPVDLGDSPALATITPKAIGSGTAGLTQAFNQYSRPALFSWFGGVATYRADFPGWSAPVVTRRTGGNFTATQTCLAQRFSFLTDAVSMDAVTNFASYRVLVNGQYVGKTVRTDGLTSGGYNRLNIALGDTTRQLRRIDIEVQFANAWFGGNSTNTLQTVYIGPNDTIVPLDTSRALCIAVVGDSFTSSTGASWCHNGWAVTLGYLLGGIDADVRQIAIGGTGYVADASSPGPQQYTFLQHIQDLAQATFDLVIFAGGINDSAASGVQPAALATIQAARALQPAAPFVVLGSWASSAGPSAGVLATEAAIQAAVRQFADPGTVFVPVSGDPAGAWIGAANGPVINGPSVGGMDGVHPGDVGHLYLARRGNAAIRTALLALGI